MKRPLLVSLLLAAAACSTDHTGPATGQPGVDLAVSTQRSSSAGTALAVSSGADATVIATLNDTVTVRGVDLVLRRLKLKPVRTEACESDDDEGDGHERAGDDGRAESDDAGCEEIKAGPILVSLPLGTTAVSALVDVTALPGQYDRVQFTIHTPRQRRDSAFLRVNPGFAGVSVRVTGTFSHQGAHSDFVYTTALEAQQQVDFSPPITVDATQTASITLRFDISTWFAKRDCATLVDPATGNDGGRNERLIRDNISQSIDAFEDERHDGHDHHDRRDGHHEHQRCVGPAIALSPDSVGFAATQGGASPAAQTVGIANSGGLTLSGLATTISYGSGQGWLTASLSSTTAPSTLTLGAAPGTLAPGTYTATVDVTSPDASNNPQSVTATLVVASPVTATFASVIAGGEQTCGLTAAGAAYCWGDGSEGQLGTGSQAGATTPAAVAGGLTFTALSAGPTRTCALTATGAVYCWGYDYDGQLGFGSTTAIVAVTTPTAVPGGSFASIAVGQQSSGTAFYTCGLTATGAAYCWGGNSFGELGTGSITASTTPVAVSGGLTFAALGAGAWLTCGLTPAGAAYCWGREFTSDVASVAVPAPALVPGGLVFTALAVGGSHVCGLTAARVAYCWGYGAEGQIGNGGTSFTPAPVAVSGGLTFTALSAGDLHTCGLTPAGAAYCWGQNLFGELGDGTTTNRSSPVAVSGALTFASLSAGVTHTCGVTPSGATWCWGRNFHGQLGDGTTTNRLTPTPVVHQ